MTESYRGFRLQGSPEILVGSLSGPWLLERATPSWRIKDPRLGFQRVVRKDRAKAIAVAVLDQGRTFPNAIVLATDSTDITVEDAALAIPDDVRFLVVDGQHRLWAQHYSESAADYACLIHTGLTEVEMAQLFLEINDNQKRVPSSLRWDLYRLVRPDDDPEAIMASDLTFELATDRSSPLFQLIDLTGENPAIALKQGSLGPEIKTLLSGKRKLRDAPFDDAYDVLVQYLIAVRDLEPDTWGTPASTFYKARVLRSMIRLLNDLLEAEGKTFVDSATFTRYLSNISAQDLDPETLKARQGNAGIAAIYREIKSSVLG